MAIKSTTKGNCKVEIDEDRLAAIAGTDMLTKFPLSALRAGAQYWHTGILPKHFYPSAGSNYRYARRSVKYESDSRKANKPDLVYSGTLRRDLESKFRVIEGKKSIKLKMFSNVLNLSGANRAKYGKMPNLKKEIRAVTKEERTAVARVVETELKAFAKAKFGA